MNNGFAQDKRTFVGLDVGTTKICCISFVERDDKRGDECADTLRKAQGDTY